MTADSPGPMAGTATLVTGGTGGIGRATAVGLATRGSGTPALASSVQTSRPELLAVPPAGRVTRAAK